MSLIPAVYEAILQESTQRHSPFPSGHHTSTPLSSSLYLSTDAPVETGRHSSPTRRYPQSPKTPSHCPPTPQQHPWVCLLDGVVGHSTVSVVEYSDVANA